MGFVEYLIRRLLLIVLVLFGITLITFVVTHVVPVDPVAAYAGPQAPPSEVAQIRQEFGLDKPLPEQYVIYLWGLLRGNLGTSIHDNRPVASDIGTYLPATIELAAAAMVVAIVIGIPGGVLAAVNHNRFVDHLARIGSLAGVSLPVFYLGLLLLAVFYVKLDVLPGPGQLSIYLDPPPRITGMMVVDSLLAGNLSDFVDALQHLIMPAVVLGVSSAGIILRITRSSMIETLREEFVRTARAKGAGRLRVVVIHALRNAMIPTVTVIGLAFGSLLAGAVLTETIFSWPGLGMYATTSVVSLDIPAIMGVTLVAAVAYSLVNLIVDLVYARLDPRIAEARG
ncbi:MAG: ABC transporter permease [Candidatus Dormibacteraeota bacterium]|nr:ABC transporter permease [Candidatus Dormibacteraeota bacterium]MBO0743567.1 ABC transporter permease [Candidatus Dormibacteraeota bacterium]